jgi:ATP-dependent Clp protease ATP-binding subunit ClpB
VIMTSNVGSLLLAAGAGRDRADIDEETRREVMDAVRKHFRPEFLNRIDETILFHPLGRAHISAVVDIQLRSLTKRLAERKITVNLSDAARERLVEEGYDPVYGARPLKRTIQRRLLDPLALKVLEGGFREGDTVDVGLANGELTFSAVRPAAAAATSQ